VDKAAHPPLSSQSLPTRIFTVRSDADNCVSKSMRSIPDGDAVAPSFASPSPPPSPQRPDTPPRRGRQGELARLRAELTALERRQRTYNPAGIDDRKEPRAAGADWTLGAPEIDGWLPDRRLDLAGLSEIKPQSYAAGPAALAFTLLLAARRLSAGRAGSTHPGLMVWCWPTRTAREVGSHYGPGLAGLGIDPANLLIVETATPADTLWAMEECLGSGAAAIVIGCLDDVALTPARRLSLAAQGQRTPGILVTAARSAVTPATFSRWRIAGCPSAPHPYDPVAPGAPRFAITLERCRGTAVDVAQPHFIVEWNHDAHRFGVVAGMADRTLETSMRV
jgi:protein ImuA